MIFDNWQWAWVMGGVVVLGMVGAALWLLRDEKGGIFSLDDDEDETFD